MFEKRSAAGWGDMDFNSHMRNTAFLDKSADVRMMFFSENSFSMDEFIRRQIGPVIGIERRGRRIVIAKPAICEPQHPVLPGMLWGHGDGALQCGDGRRILPQAQVQHAKITVPIRVARRQAGVGFEGTDRFREQALSGVGLAEPTIKFDLVRVEFQAAPKHLDRSTSTIA